MSQVVIAGDVSGTITLQAPSVAGTTVLTLPTTSGTLAVGSSAMTLISTLTASNSATLSFTGLSTYNNYVLQFQNIYPVTGTNNPFTFYMIAGYGSTPTYYTSAYNYEGIYVAYSASVNGFYAQGGSNIPLAGNSLTGITGNTPNINGFLNINNFLVGALGYNGIISNNDNTNRVTNNTISGVLNQTSNPITALQFQFSSGNIGGGKISLYGISS